MIAFVLAALQALAPIPPRALHDAGGRPARLRTATATGSVDWDALAFTVTLHGRSGEGDGTAFDRVVRVDFRPTAAAGLEPGRLAVAGRDGVRACLELWRVEDVRERSGPRLGEPTFEVVERRRVWEEVEADSIGLLVWNPVPPAGAQASVRALWHQRRELSRFDVDRAGWATMTLEASMRGPTPRDVLQVSELGGPLERVFQAAHPARGLVLMLQTPCSCRMCCACEKTSLVLVDGNRDGGLDRAVRLDLEIWDAEGWAALGEYERIFE